jgi:hypothetical protein
MNELIKKFAKQTLSKDQFGLWLAGDEDIEKFVELVVRQCGYHADIFGFARCPVGMDPTETKPSDYIKKQFGVDN